MKQYENITIKLVNPTTTKRKVLEDLQERFSAAVALGLQLAEPEKVSSRGKIHELLYYRAREEFDLPCYYATQAVGTVMTKVRSFWGSAKSKHIGPTSWPKASNKEPIGLTETCYRLFFNKDRWVLRISIGNGEFLWLPLCVPKKYHDSMSVASGEAKLYERDGKWYVVLPLRTTTDTPPSSGGSCYGVDLGVAKLATVVGPGIVRFWSGTKLQHIRRKYRQYRRMCGRQKNVRKVKASRGRESRWSRDVNHKLSRQIVDLIAGIPGGFIALEDLTGIRKRNNLGRRFNRMLGGWSFRQLRDFITYKAAKANILVVLVDPRGTSSTCPKCGSKGSRPKQSLFKCTCGYQANADYVGGVNISRRGLEAISVAP